jgi:hypothetical protein
MNKIKIICMAMAGLSLFSGCNVRKGLKTETYENRTVVSLDPGCRDSLEIKIELEYITGRVKDSVMEKINCRIIRTAFGKNYDSTDVVKASEAFKKDKADEYKEINSELLKEFKDQENSIPLSGYNYVTGYFYGNHGSIYSYDVNHSVFEGGAHGSSSDYGLNFNIETGNPVTEGSLFVQDFKNELSSLLSSHLRESMKDQDAYDALFVKDIEPNGNFLVSEDGITYIYGQYEIGPYYLGIIKVTVPWNELSDIIKDEMASKK